MLDRFAHLEDSQFPGITTVDVYKYSNDNDYSRWNNRQMRISVFSVPWDLGEAHVGNRVIEGVGNVVQFESEDVRNSYFDAQEDALRFETKYRRFHSDDEIKLPVPSTSLVSLNYIEVLYYPEPGTGDDLDYTQPDEVTRWYFFIRSVERTASNTSIVTMMLDVWQTFIYRLDIAWLQLERGHYPMSKISVDEYLTSPVNHQEWLGETVDELENFGEISKVKSTTAHVFNADGMCAVFITSANVYTGDFGTVHDEDGWQVPAAWSTITQGAPSFQAFAVLPSDLNAFLDDSGNAAPQFAQTVQGVFFASSAMLNLGESFELFGYTAYRVNPQRESFDLLTLSKSAFGYPLRYADIPKLYTSPYAAIDFYTEDGSVTRVNVEDCGGDITIYAKLSILSPWIAIDARLSGIGGDGAGSITFRNVASSIFEFDGSWYNLQFRWNCPVFALIQSPQRVNDYSTYWDRQQTATAATNQRSAENNAADLTTTNAGVTASGNSSITSNSNASASQDVYLSNALNQGLQAWNAGYTRACYTADVEAQQKQAAISTAGSVISSAANAVGSATSGDIGGAVSGLISGVVGGVCQAASTSVAVNLLETQGENAIANSQNTVNDTNLNSTQRTDNQNSTNTSNTSVNNSVTRTTAANSASTQRVNATLAYNTQIESNNNQVRGARLDAPSVFGNLTNGDTAATKPQALFASIVTQPDNAIASAGDTFLRYGWCCRKYIDNIKSFNVMPKFSYWQCSDMSIASGYIPDAYVDQLRMLLFGGVTVWRDPEDIGHTSIYENA